MSEVIRESLLSHKAFRAWLCKATPGSSTEDLWYAFEAGYLYGVCSEQTSHERAVAILRGELPPTPERVHSS